MGVTARERALLLSPTGASGVRRSARRIGRGDGRRRSEGVGGNAGGRRGRRRTEGIGRNAGGQRGRRNRVGRTAVGEADEVGTRNSKSSKITGIDVRPLDSVVHPGEACEIIGGWLIGAPILYIDLTTGKLIELKRYELKMEYVHATRVILGLPSRMKGNELIANQLGKERQFCQVEALMQRN